MICELRKRYKFIVIDSPPIMAATDAVILSALVDGVLLVARSGQTNRKALASAMATLTRLRANVIGIVMNEVRVGSGPAGPH